MVLTIVPSIVLSQSSPGFWRGQGSTDRTTDLNWVTLIIHYESDFSFTTDREGNVSGNATAHYTMHIDDSRLRGFLAQYHGVSDSMLTSIPLDGVPLGTFLGHGAKFANVQGVSGSYDAGTVVRQGTIKGRLTGNQLHLEWAEAVPPMPYKTYIVYPTKRDRLGGGDGPTYSPWMADAVVSQPAPGHWEATVPPYAATKSGKPTSQVNVWAAHQESLVSGK